MKIIVEGIDRLGKDTLITNLIDNLGYHSVIHYSSPKHTKFYAEEVGDNLELYEYQHDSFINGFLLLNQDNGINLIFNRFHLGEVVYSKRYRGYDGNYVFDLEEDYDKAMEQTYLILLYSSNVNIVTDDGKSHDFSKRLEEQNDFIEAWKRSKIRNKLAVDVYNTFSDTYHSRDFITDKVIDWINISPI